MNITNNNETILVVDDDQNNVDILMVDLESEGYKVLTASNGVECLEVMRENYQEIKAVLLDRMMPVMDGMQALAEMKKDNNLKSTPVVLQTAASETSQVSEGIRAGAYYYLTKPYEKDVMLAVVNSAIHEKNLIDSLKGEVAWFTNKSTLLNGAEFFIKDLEDVRFLSVFLSRLYKNSESVFLGISEILMNAVEHGNLGISYEEKSKLLISGELQDEVNRRLEADENKDKYAIVKFYREDDCSILEVTDQGEGFDWNKYSKMSPDRLTHPNGRGILVAMEVGFDSVEYVAPGNKVICKVKNQ